MKCTTRQAPARSNVPSSYGSSSAAPLSHVDPGNRSRQASTKGGRRVDRGHPVRSHPVDELPGERAGAAADVERALPGPDVEPVREAAGERRE